MKPKAIAVLISDIHFSIPTLELAKAALNQAVDVANRLDVNLVVAGDLHDTKANLRGECTNAMLAILDKADLRPVILVGNHDKINEKSEDNSLNFLRGPADVVSYPCYSLDLDSYLIPYQHDPIFLKSYLTTIPEGSRLIMHQGVEGSSAGDYILDKSALPKECFKDFRVISGHYHTRQQIKCGRPQKGSVGLFDYIGNPYTLNYAEAKDPSKGFQVLYDDGHLEHIPTNLRKHIVMDLTYEQLKGEHIYLGEPEDLLWVKIRGTKEELSNLSKNQVATDLDIVLQDFRLDLIPDETNTQLKENVIELKQPELLDGLIDSITNTSDEQKKRLKDLWRSL